MRWKLVSSLAVAFGALSAPLAAQTDVFVVTVTPRATPSDSSVSADWTSKRAQLMRMIDRDIQTLRFDGVRPQRSVRQATITFDPASFVLQFFPAQGVLRWQMDVPKRDNCPKAARLRES